MKNLLRQLRAERGLTQADLAEQLNVSRQTVIAIETDPARTTAEGGWWWEVAVPEVSGREPVLQARAAYTEAKRGQRP